MRRRLRQMWVPPEFENFVMVRKSEEPRKSFVDILNDVAVEGMSKKKKENKKHEGFKGIF